MGCCNVLDYDVFISVVVFTVVVVIVFTVVVVNAIAIVIVIVPFIISVNNNKVTIITKINTTITKLNLNNMIFSSYRSRNRTVIIIIILVAIEVILSMGVIIKKQLTIITTMCNVCSHCVLERECVCGLLLEC